MAKIQTVVKKKENKKVSRPGVHSKSKTSKWYHNLFYK